MGMVNIRLGEIDYLSKSQQREYLKQMESPVIVRSALDNLANVRPLEEIEKMPYERARKYIMTAKSFHSTKRLTNHWRTNSTYIYKKLYPKYDIPVGEFVAGQIKNKNGEVIKKRTLFKTQFHGTMDNQALAEELKDLLAKLQEGNYCVNVSIEELAEK